MTDWRRLRLDKVVRTLESGSRPKGGVSADGGDIPSVGGENILASGGITLEGVKRVRRAFFDRMTKGHLRPEDILINKDGAQTGKVGWYHGEADPACINEHVFLLRGDPAVIRQGFLYNFLLSATGQAQIWREITGSAQPGLKSGFLRGIELDLPGDLDEQDAIVSAIETAERQVKVLTEVVVKQRRLFAGLLQGLITAGVDTSGGIRTEGSHAFADTPLGRLPKDFELLTFGQITPNDAPIGYGIVQPGTYDHNGLRVAGIYTINSDFERWHMSSASIEAAYRRSRIRSGDVLLSIKGTVGRVGVVPEGVVGNISRELARIRPVTRVNPFWLRYLLLSPMMQRHLTKAEVGTTRAEISIKILRDLPLPVPLREEQDQVVDRLASLEAQISISHQSLVKARALKIALMQDLLSGERRMPLVPEVV